MEEQNKLICRSVVIKQYHPSCEYRRGEINLWKSYTLFLKIDPLKSILTPALLKMKPQWFLYREIHTARQIYTQAFHSRETHSISVQEYMSYILDKQIDLLIYIAMDKYIPSEDSYETSDNQCGAPSWANISDRMRVIEIFYASSWLPYLTSYMHLRRTNRFIFYQTASPSRDKELSRYT